MDSNQSDKSEFTHGESSAILSTADWLKASHGVTFVASRRGDVEPPRSKIIAARSASPSS